MQRNLIFLIIGLFLGLVAAKILLPQQTKIVKETNCPALAEQAQQPTKKLGTLPPPEFADSVGKIIKSDMQGHVLIRFKKVPGVTKYRIFLTDEKGHRVTTRISSSNIFYFDTIPMPDNTSTIQYNVQMASLGDNSKEGPLGEMRKLIVTDGSGSSLAAPKIKSIRVED